MAQHNRYTGGIGISRRWQDWINLILGVWLFVSPWVLGYAAAYAPAATSGETAAGTPVPTGGALSSATWDSWIFGVVIGIVALAAVARIAPWQSWVTLIVGVWLFIAPWMLAFSGAANPAWNHWIVGVLVFLVSLSALPYFRRTDVDYAHAGEKPLDRP